jgi:hypothetical protein
MRLLLWRPLIFCQTEASALFSGSCEWKKDKDERFKRTPIRGRLIASALALETSGYEPGHVK